MTLTPVENQGSTNPDHDGYDDPRILVIHDSPAG